MRPDDLQLFDYVLAMDRANLDELGRFVERPPRAQLGLFLEFAPGCGEDEVPDPYYGSQEDFERVLELCEAGARGLLQKLSSPA